MNDLRFNFTPQIGLSELRFGMPRTEIRLLLNARGEDCISYSLTLWFNRNKDYFYDPVTIDEYEGLFMNVYYDGDDKFGLARIFCESPLVIIYNRISLLNISYSHIKNRLQEMGHEERIDDDGPQGDDKYHFDDLGLSIYVPPEEDFPEYIDIYRFRFFEEDEERKLRLWEERYGNLK